jgi:exonuclease SbcC
MITSVELNNFLSHGNSIINFDHGVTVLVGHNGAGKSAIMDAIIFSMFGEKRRDSIEKLQKEGENQTYVKTSFEINGKLYHTVKKIQNGATKGHEITDDSGSLLAKSATEAVKKIKELIDLDYNDLRIASIVPADELTRITTEASELRSLIDKVMGAEKYSKLEKLLKEAIKDFRINLQDRYGYTYENLVPLKQKISDAKQNKKKFDTELKKLESNLNETKQKKDELEEKIQAYKKNSDSKKQFEEKKDEFTRHVKNVIMQKRSEYEREKEKFDRCKKQFPIADRKKELDDLVNEIENKIDNNQEEIQELNKKISSLIEQIKLAKKLQLTDGKCPVCDKEVDQLKPLFQEEHLEKEKREIEYKLSGLNDQQKKFSNTRSENKSSLENATTASIILNENGISNKEQLEEIERNIGKQNNEITSFGKMLESEQFLEVSIIDSTSTDMYRSLKELQKNAKEFNQIEFEKLEKQCSEIDIEYTGTMEELGRKKAILESSEKDIKDLTPIVEELELAKEFVSNIDNINSDIFSTQSKTFTGLRYFTLRKISDRASSYLEILKTQVQRVNLFQERASVKIDCETVSGIRPVKNLSSGEQVCVALSIRLAMAEIMTKSPLKVMILDEPTAHLDQEHCELFLDALKKLTDNLNQNKNFQFIISTHQEELWANTKIGTIYRLENPTGKNTVIKH